MNQCVKHMSDMTILKMLLIHILIFIMLSILSLMKLNNKNTMQDVYALPSIEITSDHYDNNNMYRLSHANCSIESRNKYQQNPYNNKSLLKLVKNTTRMQYEWDKVPKGTFTYWLSHIYFQNRIE
eukprot:305704_1